MKIRNITTGGIHVQPSSETQIALVSTESGNAIAFFPKKHPCVEGNSNLIVDAFNVADKYGYTPSMLWEERQGLLANQKETWDSMVEVLQSDLKLSEIVSQRKVFLEYLKESRTRLMAHSVDPMGGKFDKDSPNYDFIKLLDTLID